MKIILQVLAVIALLGTIAPSIAVFYGVLDLDVCKTYMWIFTLIWFLTGPKLMNQSTDRQP
jgi:hypothetical protein